MADHDKVMADKESGENIMGDIKNFSPKDPIFLIGEMIIS